MNFQRMMDPPFYNLEQQHQQGAHFMGTPPPEHNNPYPAHQQHMMQNVQHNTNPMLQNHQHSHLFNHPAFSGIPNPSPTPPSSSPSPSAINRTQTPIGNNYYDRVQNTFPMHSPGLQMNSPSPQNQQPLLVPKVEIFEEPSPPHQVIEQDSTSFTPPSNPQTESSNNYYQCSICYKNLKTAKAYKNHMKTHNLNPIGLGNSEREDSDKWQVCNYCNKVFYDIEILKEHLLFHMKEEHPPHPLVEKCQFCFKLFADRSQLTLHLKDHNDLKDYKCLNCNKMYASLNYLKLHYKMHADEKPYKCNYCDKRFTFSSNLYVHNRIHTGVKPYHCKICNKSFSQINSLKQHNRVHKDYVPQQLAQSTFPMESHEPTTSQQEAQQPLLMQDNSSSSNQQENLPQPN